jgi:hypothetical protein
MISVRSNWPVRLTTFVGREQERAAIGELLGDTRLVTCTGLGGAGKTRLALEIGGDLQAACRDGGFFAELASVVDTAAVPQRIASASQRSSIPDAFTTRTTPYWTFPVLLGEKDNREKRHPDEVHG